MAGGSVWSRGAKLVALCLVALSLASCGRLTQGIGGIFSGDRRVAFDGEYFRARLSPDDAVPQRFLVSVDEPGKSLVGAREAGRYEAVKYCIRNYSWSGIDWRVSPDAGAGGVVLSDGNLILQGECLGWR